MFVSPESSPGRNFYPRPPRGGRRRSSQRACRSRSDFYPRPPRGGRLCPVWPRRGEWRFLSTPSARRATDVKATAYNKALISIHALREEGDGRCTGYCLRQQHFYPRPPRGGRPVEVQHLLNVGQFLSTPSARRATSGEPVYVSTSDDFYPRPPRGGRRGGCLLCGCAMEFLSTPSARRATNQSTTALTPLVFLSTPSARRATKELTMPVCVDVISIHALREEGDAIAPPMLPQPKKFLSTPSARRATDRPGQT